MAELLKFAQIFGTDGTTVIAPADPERRYRYEGYWALRNAASSVPVMKIVTNPGGLLMEAIVAEMDPKGIQHERFSCAGVPGEGLDVQIVDISGPLGALLVLRIYFDRVI